MKQIITVSIVLIVCIFVLSAFLSSCNIITGLFDKTMNPDQIVYNYEYFKKQYEDYLAIIREIK